MLQLMPIGDEPHYGRTHAPIVTYVLIAINIAVFFLLQVPNERFTYGYAVVPAEITSGHDIVDGISTRWGVIPQAPGPSPIFLTILTAMFMHGGFMHLFGNMLYMWIFGDNVEDAMGHTKFLIFYLVCGVAATFAQIFVAPSSPVPSLGASGAIAGVLGGYLLMYPARRVRVIGWFGIAEVPALVVIGLWGVLQFMNGVASIAPGTEQGKGGVAYWAHIGGFVAGMLLVSFFKNPDTQRRVQQRMNLTY